MKCYSIQSSGRCTIVMASGHRKSHLLTLGRTPVALGPHLTLTITLASRHIHSLARQMHSQIRLLASSLAHHLVDRSRRPTIRCRLTIPSCSRTHSTCSGRCLVIRTLCSITIHSSHETRCSWGHGRLRGHRLVRCSQTRSSPTRWYLFPHAQEGTTSASRSHREQSTDVLKPFARARMGRCVSRVFPGPNPAGILPVLITTISHRCRVTCMSNAPAPMAERCTRSMELRRLRAGTRAVRCRLSIRLRLWHLPISWHIL